MSEVERQNRPHSARNLPVPVARPEPEPRPSRYDLPSTFVSHLIATRDRMGLQRARNRAPAQLASGAYEEAKHRAVRRMPSGYRLSQDA